MSHRRSLTAFIVSWGCIGALACTSAETADTGQVTMEAPVEVPDADGTMESLLARGDALELPTEWEPIPGEPIHHHTSGFAKTLCSGTFITGLDWRDAAENVGGFTSPFDQRSAVVDTVVDMDAKMVSLTLGDGVTRTAKLYGSQGCITHPMGEDSIYKTREGQALEPYGSTTA